MFTSAKSVNDLRHSYVSNAFLLRSEINGPNAAGVFPFKDFCVELMAAPEGNKNAVKNRPWAEAINRVLLAEDGKKLRALAEKIVEKALEGDVSALKEVGDRSDGKPAQQLVHSGDRESPVVLKWKK